ncbi:hypothetical protein [Ktedonobacter robiniae]|nr:hypothetical protein [Ktedonobacter robiniae]
MTSLKAGGRWNPPVTAVSALTITSRCDFCQHLPVSCMPMGKTILMHP